MVGVRGIILTSPEVEMRRHYFYYRRIESVIVYYFTIPDFLLLYRTCWCFRYFLNMQYSLGGFAKKKWVPVTAEVNNRSLHLANERENRFQSRRLGSVHRVSAPAPRRGNRCLSRSTLVWICSVQSRNSAPMMKGFRVGSSLRSNPYW